MRTDLVRPYVITGGRHRPSRNTHSLDLVTLVTATGDRPLGELEPEQQKMVRLCQGGYLSVAEVAGHVRLPVSVTAILLADLVDSGHMVVRKPPPAARPTDLDVLEKVLDGLNNIL
ncbi:DUF742 domain-containing protein [Streptomyces glaucosporus]|uniref:DUF742 domain-containing protein n=1 Tax=Streptomyces glaucosporus TaxID=284044 RepID=UPI003CD086EA